MSKNRLREIRGSMSRPELSRLLALEPMGQSKGKPVSEHKISRWERGLTPIPVDRVFELAQIFGVTPEHLMCRDTKPKLRRVK